MSEKLITLIKVRGKSTDRTHTVIKSSWDKRAFVTDKDGNRTRRRTGVYKDWEIKTEHTAEKAKFADDRFEKATPKPEHEEVHDKTNPKVLGTKSADKASESKEMGREIGAGIKEALADKDKDKTKETETAETAETTEPKEETTETEDTKLAELKKTATGMGIKFHPRIGIEKLEEKIKNN